MAAHILNPCIWEADRTGFKVSLGYTEKPCSKYQSGIIVNTQREKAHKELQSKEFPETEHHISAPTQGQFYCVHP